MLDYITLHLKEEESPQDRLAMVVSHITCVQTYKGDTFIYVGGNEDYWTVKESFDDVLQLLGDIKEYYSP